VLVEQTLMKMEQSMVDALVKGDASGWDHSLAGTFMFTAPDGSTQTKAEWMADFKNGALKMASSQNDDMKVQQYGNAAVVTYRSTDHGTYNGKDISGQYRWTDVFVKHNGNGRSFPRKAPTSHRPQRCRTSDSIRARIAQSSARIADSGKSSGRASPAACIPAARSADRAMMLCKPHPEPTLRMASNFHG